MTKETEGNLTSAGIFSNFAPANPPALEFTDTAGIVGKLWFRNGVLDYEGDLPPTDGAKVFMQYLGHHFRDMIAAEAEKQTAALRRELDEALTRCAGHSREIIALRADNIDFRANNAKKDAALRCARIKLARYWEQHGSSAIGGVAAEYDAVVKLIDAALAPVAQEPQ